MRVVLQRVSSASVLINSAQERAIGHGILVLLGVENADTKEDADWLINKVNALRIFSDEAGKMNLSIQDVGGELLVISQFTLHASTKKGTRPSYIRASKPDHAIPLYDYFVEQGMKLFPARLKTGDFGADMKVSLVNDGPVTIMIDSKERE